MGGPGSGRRLSRPDRREQYATALAEWMDDQPDSPELRALRVLVRACYEGWREFAADAMDNAVKHYPNAGAMRASLADDLGGIGGHYLHEAYEATAPTPEDA